MVTTLRATVIALLALFFTTPAFAQCVVPHVLVNGQVADASQVMDNFSAVADCADQSVKADGNAQTGEIAVISGPTSVTGGDLSGDVSTAGSTVTTLANTGVIAGNYTNPSISVDAKGRITAAASGSGGGGGSSGWIELTLINPNAESGDTTGWTMIGGGFTATTADPPNHVMTPTEGSYSFTASANPNPEMLQSVDLSAYVAAIDSGSANAMLEAYSVDTYATGEYPYVYITFVDGTGNDLAHALSPTQQMGFGTGKWRILSVTSRIPEGTRSMVLHLWAKRVNGTTNNISFDRVRTFIGGF